MNTATVDKDKMEVPRGTDESRIFVKLGSMQIFLSTRGIEPEKTIVTYKKETGYVCIFHEDMTKKVLSVKRELKDGGFLVFIARQHEWTALSIGR